jgi:hypothetical protein
MKVLLVAPMERIQDTGHYLSEEFTKIGCDVSVFDYRKVANMHNIQRMNEDLQGYAKQLNPDLTLILKGEMLCPDVVKALPNKKALWYFDLEIPKPMLDLSAAVDTFFLHVFDSETVNKYKEVGANIKILEQGCPEKYYHMVAPDPKYESDICFIGSYKPVRDKYLRFLDGYCKEKCKTLKVWGNGWGGTKLESVWQGGDIYHEEFCKAVCSANINVGFGYGEYFERDISFRLYQILGCGGFLLHNYVAEINKLYKNTRDLFMVKDVADLDLVLDHVFRNDEYIHNDIGRSGRYTTLNNHTYGHRVKQLIKEVGL